MLYNYSYIERIAIVPQYIKVFFKHTHNFL